MKKISLFFALLIVLALSVTACGPKKPSCELDDGVMRVAYLTDLGGLAGSDEMKGFSDLGWDAVLMAEEKLGVTKTLLEANELSDLEPNLTKMADECNDMIIGGGFLFTDAVNAVAPKYPDVKFVIVDGYAEGPNVQNVVFASNEGSFLVGALAAGMTETGTIAFIGGMEGPLIEEFEAGYIAGALAIDPEIEVLSGYTGNFDDPGSGKELALAQYAQGGDVNYAAAGAGVFGAIEAADENGFYAIGVDTNMDHLAPGVVLSSMLKKVDLGTYYTIEDFVTNGNFEAGYKRYSLADGTIDYSKGDAVKDIIPADLYAAVDALAAKINAGEIVVPTTVAEAMEFTLE